MQNQCLLAQFEREILQNVGVDGKCTFAKLLKRIGPDHRESEFWSALSYCLSVQSVRFEGRNKMAAAVLVPSSYVPFRQVPADWYKIDYSWSYGGGSRYFREYPMPSIPMRLVKAQFTNLRLPDDTPQTIAERLLEQFPELKLLNWQDSQHPNSRIISEIIAPAMLSELPVAAYAL